MQFILLQIPGRIYSLQGYSSFFSRYQVGYTGMQFILLQIPGRIYRDAVHSSPDTR